MSHLDVADMRAQVAERDARLATNGHSAGARTGVLAVVSGAGMARLYESLGAHVLDGGPTLNPSTHELLAGIHAVPSEEVVVLPNSANVIMAAERAAELAEKAVRVVVSTSQQAGLAAAVALTPDADADTNAGAMRVAIAAVRTGAVAPAAREDAAGRFAVGDAVGFVDDELVAWGATGADAGGGPRRAGGRRRARDLHRGGGRAAGRRRHRRAGARRGRARARGRRPAVLLVAARR